MSRLQLRKIGYLRVELDEVFGEFDGQIFVLETSVYQVFKSLTEKDLSDSLAEVNMTLRDFVRNHFADRYMTVDDTQSPGFLRRQVANEIRAIDAPVAKRSPKAAVPNPSGSSLNETVGGVSTPVSAQPSKPILNSTVDVELEQSKIMCSGTSQYIVESAPSVQSSTNFIAPKPNVSETVKSSSSEDEMPTHDSSLPASIRAPPIKRTTVRHPAPQKLADSGGLKQADGTKKPSESSSTTSSTSAADPPPRPLQTSAAGVWAPAASSSKPEWCVNAAKMIDELRNRPSMLDEAALIDLNDSEPNDPSPSVKRPTVVDNLPIAESIEDEESAEERARRRANSPKRRLAEAAEAEFDCFDSASRGCDGSDSALDSLGKPRDEFTKIVENARVEVRYQRDDKTPQPLPRSHEVPVADELEDFSILDDKQPAMIDTTKLFYRVRLAGIPNTTEVNSYRDKYEELVALNTRLYEDSFDPTVQRLRENEEYAAYVIFLLKYIQHHYPSGIIPHDLQRLEDDLSRPNPAQRYLGSSTALNSFAEFYDLGYLYIKRGVIYPAKELVDIELWGLPPGLPSNLYRLLSQGDQLVCEIPEHVGILLKPNKESCYLQPEDIVRVANCYPLVFTIKAYAIEQYSLRNARISLHKDLPRWKVLLDDMTFITKTPRHCDCFNCLGYKVVDVPGCD